tara:strand:- start:521 stop:931 length:411 start_codon:yes stop_codon:yes gene_type:complete
MLPSISTQVNSLRTDTVSETPSCTTGVADTSCVVNLQNKSAYENTNPNWEIQETSPSSVTRTSQSALASDLQQVTISGLSSNTSYAFQIDYFKVNAQVQSASHLDSLLKRFSFVLVIGLLLVMVIGVSKSYAMYSQ